MPTCPHCADRRAVLRRTVPVCGVCRSSGVISDDLAARFAAGCARRAERKVRDASLLEEAQRLGLPLVALSRLERGGVGIERPSCVPADAPLAVFVGLASDILSGRERVSADPYGMVGWAWQVDCFRPLQPDRWEFWAPGAERVTVDAAWLRFVADLPPAPPAVVSHEEAVHAES